MVFPGLVDWACLNNWMEHFMDLRVAISHWLPVISFCPVNKLPDLLYITVEFEGSEFHELYSVRKRIRKISAWRRCFMEDIAVDLFNEFPDAVKVQVKLITGRHIITMKREN